MTELEKAAVEAFKQLGSTSYLEIFKAGAKWQYDQFEKERLKHCDELTAEQAQIESDFVVQHLKNFNRTPTFIDAIEYGRKIAFEEACNFIKINAEKHIYFDEGNNEWYDTEEFIEDFKKAMEE